MQLETQTTKDRLGALPVHPPHALLGHLTCGRAATRAQRASNLQREPLLWAADAAGAQIVNVTEKVAGTKIAVFHPQLAGLHRLEEGPKQRAFLRMAVFTGEDIGASPRGRLIDHHRCAGPGTPRGCTRFLDAMLTGCEAVAIDDCDPIPRQPGGVVPAHVLDERGKFTRAVAHQCSRGMRLSAMKFVRDGDE